tara:strand:+ start:1250 stop:1501 length:252 start_codon:yes stop_codon:yes gene_type:complete
MKELMLNRIVIFLVGFFLIVFPLALHAVEINSSVQEIETNQIVESPEHMTKDQINDLFGEDPYLGQTSYLQSPDGFSQKEKSK